MPRAHQPGNEIRQEQHVRIQGQDPIAAGERDGLVLGAGEADVLLVVDNAASRLVLPEDIDGAVGGGVVNHHDLEAGVLLGQHRIQALLDEPAAVVGDDGYRYEVVGRHEHEPDQPRAATSGNCKTSRSPNKPRMASKIVEDKSEFDNASLLRQL